jgi:hypothetical protein
MDLKNFMVLHFVIKLNKIEEGNLQLKKLKKVKKKMKLIKFLNRINHRN